MPIFKAKKLILAGDPMQLPPTILSTNKKRDKKAVAKKSEKTNIAKASKERTGSRKPSSDMSKPPVDKEDVSAQEIDDNSSSTSEDDIDGDNAPAMPSNDTTSTRRLRTNGLTPPRSLETTLFDRLEKMYGPGIKRLLNVQYRYLFSLASLAEKVVLLTLL